MKRIGIDTGGTFTDSVCWDEHAGLMSVAKASSDAINPSNAVRASIRKLEQSAGLQRGDSEVRCFLHGTTVATNAVLERSGPQVAVITTNGFRDVLEIGRLTRTPEQLYDIKATRSVLALRRNRFEIPGRVDHKGMIVEEIDPAAICDIASQLKHRGIRDVAVCLLHSYVNSTHEQRVREILQAELQDVNISLSSEVLPEFREYERTSTTTLNAYLVPSVSSYLNQLETSLTQWYPSARLWIMQSNGGLASPSRSAQVPVTLLLSGPSGGVVASRYAATEAGLSNTITMDMGGTSCDVAVLPNNDLPVTHERTVLDMPVRVPSLDMLAIGSGGGSIAWLNAAGELQVGPQSAGAQPGPACYGRGGDEPTVTDANLVLGILYDGQRLGDDVKLDAALAHRTCEQLAKTIGLTTLETAWGIRRIANAAMAGAVRAISIGRGYDPRDFALIAFGAAGPMHAMDIANEVDIPRVFIPPAPGCHSALGQVVTDVIYDYVTTTLVNLASATEAQLEQAFRKLEVSALAELESEKIPLRNRVVVRSLDLRYVGQQFSINIVVGSSVCDLPSIRTRFDASHEALYGFSVPDEPVEAVAVRVRGIGQLSGRIQQSKAPSVRAQSSLDPAATRSVAYGPSDIDVQITSVFPRSALFPGATLQGPCIVEQDDATILIPPITIGECDLTGNLLLWQT